MSEVATAPYLPFVGDDWDAINQATPETGVLEHINVAQRKAYSSSKVERVRRIVRRGEIKHTTPSLNLVGTVDSVLRLGDSTFRALSSWNGTVISRTGEQFLARLSDPRGKRSDEEAVIPIEEIPEFDHELVEPGAMFYWTIGYRDTSFGLRSRISEIRFRRLPVWDATVLDQAKANADRLRQLFD